MLELFHAVLTSLLLSAAVGCGADPVAATDDEPANKETGVDVGKMPSHLLSPRGNLKCQQDDDQQPASLPLHVAFCEPAVWVGRPIQQAQSLPLPVDFPTAGRSP